MQKAKLVGIGPARSSVVISVDLKGSDGPDRYAVLKQEENFRYSGISHGREQIDWRSIRRPAEGEPSEFGSLSDVTNYFQSTVDTSRTQAFPLPFNEARSILQQSVSNRLSLISYEELCSNSLHPGECLHICIKKTPRAKPTIKTIIRLAKMSAGTRRQLKQAKKKRLQRLHVYVRGNRKWVSRESAARVICGEQITVGFAWTMCYSHSITEDIKSIFDYVTISKYTPIRIKVGDSWVDEATI